MLILSLRPIRTSPCALRGRKIAGKPPKKTSFPLIRPIRQKYVRRCGNADRQADSRALMATGRCSSAFHSGETVFGFTASLAKACRGVVGNFRPHSDELQGSSPLSASAPLAESHHGRTRTQADSLREVPTAELLRQFRPQSFLGLHTKVTQALKPNAMPWIF